MIVSMTGFGSAAGTFRKKNYLIELRSVNNRFCEISMKYPKFLASADFELKEIIRKKISRGKINVNITADAADEDTGIYADEEQIDKIYRLALKVREVIGSKEQIQIGHILSFTDLFTADKAMQPDKEEVEFINGLLGKALDDLLKMKVKEGDSLRKDILERIKFIDKESAIIAKVSKAKISLERKRLRERVAMLVTDKKVIDERRLELEITLLADKIDITEELIRLKSHTKYFAEYSKSEEFAGRRLNFLIQEINREINTIASKSVDAEISQRSSVMKEELEKIREQLQNVE